MSMFAQPAAPSSGDKFDYATHVGSLILIEPSEFLTDFETSAGVSNAVRATVAVIDGPGVGESYGDALLFGKVLTGQLRNSIGVKVLGRLGQGAKVAGKSPAWILNPAEAADIAKAEAWVTAQAKPAVTSAAPPF